MSEVIFEGTLGVVGGGNMAKSILTPLVEKGLLMPQKIIVSTSSSTSLEYWKNLGCGTTLDNGKLVMESHAVIWAVKPQLFPNVIKNAWKSISIGSIVNKTPEKLHISIMAGISMEDFGKTISNYLNFKRETFRVVRVMPNIGMKVSCGVAVFAVDPLNSREEDGQLMTKMFTPLGLCYQTEESKINAYCALFGSGIGFMFPIIEALSDGAVKVGIPRANSLKIAAQVLKGAGELMLNENCHPGVLKDMVCSPGGTTIAGIAELENGAVRSSIIKAVEAATLRGVELGKGTSADSQK